MNSDIPLFDIANIPYFPYQPGVLAWILFAMLTLLVFLALYFYGKSFRKRSNKKAFSICYTELERLKESLMKNPSYGKEALFRASLITRRLISSLEPEDVSNMSEREIAEFKERCKDRPLQDILALVASLEKSKFKAQVELEESVGLIKNLSNALTFYRESKLQAST